ncbi:unnamed protein product [Cylicocyclus nassatus]|uniref:Uncharacterized protein n=1 Tax=Cylicocyclus nassatus TaxID=53992 RepID=A0AA36MEA1_CYLNA|nr:unnamed protein product [Cylicocyclus nassatus]
MFSKTLLLKFNWIECLFSLENSLYSVVSTANGAAIHDWSKTKRDLHVSCRASILDIRATSKNEKEQKYCRAEAEELVLSEFCSHKLHLLRQMNKKKGTTGRIVYRKKKNHFYSMSKYL